MSYQNFKEAILTAPNCNFFTTAGGCTKEQIEKSEDILDVKFSKQAVEFYQKYGYLSFYGHEIFGIDPDDDSGELEGNSVAYTLNERTSYGLNKNWIPFYNFNDGRLAFFDYSNLNAENEPQIIMGYYDGSQYRLIDIISNDFGDFLLSLVKDCLNS